MLKSNFDFCYISISSNLGDRKKNIELAIDLISNIQYIDVIKISSLLEYPALYKNISDIENLTLNYYNLVLKIKFHLDDPFFLLSLLQEVEIEIGKNLEKTKNTSIEEKSFNARLIDIDILLFKDLHINDQRLIIPHYDLMNRSFFIDLISEIDSNIAIQGENILEIRRRLNGKNSLLMHIINLNNNSFSGDGILENFIINYNKLEQIIKYAICSNVAIIDIGVISTAPCNEKIIFSIDEEINILTSILNFIKKQFKESQYKYLLPKISIDTFRYEVMEFLINNNYHFDIINDQEGFKDYRKIELFKNTNHDIIVMHSLTLPVKKDFNIIGDLDESIAEIKNFFKEKKDQFIKNNINLSRLIIDPGIGFGKTSEQSVFILKNIKYLFDLNLKIIIGHSRKRFISYINKNHETAEEKDFHTAIISTCLNKHGVEILRVHNSYLTQQAILTMLNFNN